MSVKTIRKFKCKDGNTFLREGEVYEVYKDVRKGKTAYISSTGSSGDTPPAFSAAGFERFFGDWENDFIKEGTPEWDMGFIAGETVPEYDIGVIDASKEFLSFVTNIRLRLGQGEDLTKRLEEKEAELETRIKELS